MKYSYNWLQKHIEEKLPSPEILKETIIFHAFEVESVEEKNGDSIFDIKVLPDRAGDCLSHYGMAREIAGLLKLTLKTIDVPALPEMPLPLPVEIKSDHCRRYIAIQMDGVTIGPSPEWLKSALESVGQRSINNVVDATNYILLDTGQPTHAFDRAKIDGGITVRLAHDGETIITLSEESKILTPDMLVIADYVGALAIAGVKGGKTAEISLQDATTSIILEIANFDPTNIRKTARGLGLATDASKRFENNLSSEIAATAAAQLVALIQSIAGGTYVGVVDHYAKPHTDRTVSFDLSDITRLLGSSIALYTIEDVFDRYKYKYTNEGEQFVFTVPYWRNDIVGAHDIVEEIGRVIGYDLIGATPLPTAFAIEHSTVFQAMQCARSWLIQNGYQEVMNYTFVGAGEISVIGGASNKSALRTNLSDALKNSYDTNLAHAPLLGLESIKLFEIGTVFFNTTEKPTEEIRVAIVDKGLVTEVPLATFIADHTIGVHPTVFAQTNDNAQFVSWSLYPYIVRDIAVWTTDDAAQTQLETLVTDFAKKYCVRAPVLFDRFTKADRTSVAYRLVFQASDRTLTEEMVDGWMTTLVAEIKSRPIFEIR